MLVICYMHNIFMQPCTLQLTYNSKTITQKVLVDVDKVTTFICQSVERSAFFNCSQDMNIINKKHG